jgi:hypothetical protein
MDSTMQKLSSSISERHLLLKYLLSLTMHIYKGSDTRSKRQAVVQCGLPSVPRALKYMRFVYS